MESDKEITNNIWRAYLEVVEGKKLTDKQKKHMDKDNDGDIDGEDLSALRKEEKTECPKCEGEGCDHCDGKGYHTEEAPADPVKKAPARKGDKSNADPASKQIDEGVGQFSVKKRKSTVVRGNDKEKVPDTVETKFDIVHKGKVVGDLRTDDYLAYIHGSLYGKDLPELSNYGTHRSSGISSTLQAFLKSKTGQKWATTGKLRGKNILESVKQVDEEAEAEWLADLALKLDELNKADSHTKGATSPEGIADKESPKSKKFMDMHKKSEKDIEDKEEQGHKDVTKVTDKTPTAKDRGGDQLANGDKAILK